MQASRRRPQWKRGEIQSTAAIKVAQHLGCEIERHTQTKKSICRADHPEISGTGVDHRGINTEEAMPEATALRRDHGRDSPHRNPKKCRALFEQQSHRAPELISGLGQTYLKVDISTSVETVSRDRHHNLVCSRRANSETVVMLVLSAVLEIHLLWHMRCAGFSCNSKRAMNPLPNTRASIFER